MVELIWDGKYDAGGKRTAPLRLKLPFKPLKQSTQVPNSANWPWTCSILAGPLRDATA